MVNLIIYSIIMTLVALILIWVLYVTEKEMQEKDKRHKQVIDYTIDVCRGCRGFYDEQLKRNDLQIQQDAELINELRKENWDLKNNN